MKLKQADVKYCGVNEEKIKTSHPILNPEVARYHHFYITERTNIYKRKEILKLPQPWTNDEVFLTYRFTNTRRELDTQTKWLISHIANNELLTLKEKIYNCMLFRTFNKSKTSELYGDVIIDIENININYYKDIFINYEKENPNYVFFTAAFMTGGLKRSSAFIKPPYIRREVDIITPNSEKIKMDYSHARYLANKDSNYKIQDWEDNIPTRMIRFIKRYVEEGVVNDIMNAKSPKEIHDRLTQMIGFGDFLAYQVFVDMTYIKEFKFSENEFTSAGIGCKAGLDLLFDDNDNLTYEELIFWLRDNIEEYWDKNITHVNFNELYDFLPKYDRCLNIMMLENSLCELKKFTNTKRKVMNPKIKYKPSSSRDTQKLNESW